MTKTKITPEQYQAHAEDLIKEAWIMMGTIFEDGFVKQTRVTSVESCLFRAKMAARDATGQATILARVEAAKVQLALFLDAVPGRCC